MSNISSTISGHNKNLVSPTFTQCDCNCCTREGSPLQNQCLTLNIIYRAELQFEANNDYKFHFEVAQAPFIERFWNHNKDFSHR